MKRLLAITILGLALSYPSLSFAFDHMDLYTKPVVKNEVNGQTKGGSLEKDLMSFYTSPKLANTPTSLIADQRSDDEYISIFGVQVLRTHRA